MALVLKDRVRVTSTTAGTGAFTLGSAATGYQDFSVIGTGNTTYYTIADQSGANWEVGLGTYTAPNQLSRDTVYESSNANALVNFGSGTKDVFVTFPAEAVTSGGGGTVTQVNTSGGVSGITLTGGPITSTGTVTLGGSLDLSSPPAIGGTTPNTITGTVLGSTNYIELPFKTVGNVGVGYLQMLDGGDGFDYLNIYGDDGSGSGPLPVKFPNGADITGNLSITGTYAGQKANFLGIPTVESGSINLIGYSTGYGVVVQAPASPVGTGYTLTLPTSAGSNNQVLKTDGSGNLSWLDFGSPPAIGGTVANTGAFTTLSASSTVSGTGFSTYLASPPAIGGTAAAAGTFTTLSSTSIANTASIARAGGKTSVTSVLNQATFTTGGTTLASQTAAANSTWRIRAFGTFTAVSNATARTAQVAVFWNSTQLGAITPTVLASTAQTTQWQLEFTVTGSSTTAVWTAGTLLNRINSTTALAVDTVTPASVTVTAGAQTIDLRFRVSTAVAAEGWNVQSVTIERLV